ncbi:MAG: hypothetical protein U0572_15040 [Phycisphaerales bacterium]
MSDRDGTPRALLRRLQPFVVAARWRFEHIDLAPFGVAVPAANRFDVLASRSARFLDRLVALDRRTFGPEGMPMPEWLFVDGSALPGVIAGLGLPAREIPEDALARLGGADAADDFMALSMYIAVPARPPQAWYGHNLASLNALVPELNLRGLGALTKALGLRVMRCVEQLGATQWASKALHVHTRFGAMELLSAWTPAHSDPATLTYRIALGPRSLDDVLDGLRPRIALQPTLHVDPRDVRALRTIESRLEHGERWAIVAPPERQPDGGVRVPVARLADAPTA